MTGLPFCISIRPFQIKHQGICGVRIQNRHTIASTFAVTGQAEDESIQFEAMPTKVTIPPGQNGALCVRVRRKRAFLGLRCKSNFFIQVQASDGTCQTVPGQLECTPLLSILHLAIFLLAAASFLMV